MKHKALSLLVTSSVCLALGACSLSKDANTSNSDASTQQAAVADKFQSTTQDKKSQQNW